MLFPREGWIKELFDSKYTYLSDDKEGLQIKPNAPKKIQEYYKRYLEEINSLEPYKRA